MLTQVLPEVEDARKRLAGLKNLIRLDNYYLPDDLTALIKEWTIMRFRLIVPLLFAFLTSSIFSLTAEGESLHYGVFNSTKKIRPTQSVGKRKKITIRAARNEYESFQISIAGPVTVTDAIPGNLEGPVTLPSRHIKIYREGLIKINKVSNYEGAKGWWPDPLIPKKDVFEGETRNAFPLIIPSGENRTIWVDVFIPPRTPAGKYSGEIIIYGPEHELACIAFTLKVWNFTLPSVSSLPTAFGFSGWNVLNGHFENRDEHYDDIVPLSVKYLDAALMHRLTLDGVFVEDWSIYGTLPIDFSEFDQVWKPFIEGKKLPYGLKGAKMTSAQIPDYGSSDSEKVAYWADFSSHFKSKGWFDILFDYTFDEPDDFDDFEEIKKRAGLVHQAMPDLPVLVTTDIQEASKYRVIDEIDLWVPLINFIYGKPYEVCWSREYEGNQRSLYNDLFSQGKELWWYQSCMSHGCSATPPEDKCESDYPSYMIDHPAVMNRIMPWMTFFYDLHGELYFSTIYAYEHGNPWGNQYYFGGNGDGTLFYPGKPDIVGGTTHIPVASVRLKMIREGMEDYEYMKILEKAGLRQVAITKIKKIITNAYTYSHNPSRLLKIRNQLANVIIRHKLANDAPQRATLSNPSN